MGRAAKIAARSTYEWLTWRRKGIESPRSKIEAIPYVSRTAPGAYGELLLSCGGP